MKFLQQFSQTNLFKISFYNGLSLFVKLLAGFISSKAIAYFLGPSGLVLTANLRNFIAVSENIGLMGLQNAIVIEVAQNKDNKEKLNTILQTLMVFFLGCTLVLSLIIVLFYKIIAQKLLLQEYSFIILWAAFFIPHQVFYIFFLQILNGLQEFKKLYLTHIFGNIFYVIFSVILLWKLGVLGGLISVLFAPFILFCVALYYYKPQFNVFFIFKTFDYQLIKSLLPITLMI
jgi:PST family polysaccharide transporter